MLDVSASRALLSWFMTCDHEIGLAASTLSLIVIGLVVLICGGLYEVRTKRDALFPPMMFKDFTISKRHVSFGCEQS